MSSRIDSFVTSPRGTTTGKRRTRIQENEPCTDKQGQKYWPQRCITDEKPPGEISPISALTYFVTPLMQNPMMIPQLIFNHCVVFNSHLQQTI